MAENHNDIQLCDGQQAGQIILYQAEESLSLEVKVDSEHNTVWLNTPQMAQLFNREDSVIRKHINNIFKEGELERNNNVQFLHVIGVKKPVPFYNLDIIISVGYRVKSRQGILFRRWATDILRDYLLNGYAISHHLVALQQQMDARMTTIESRQEQQQKQLDFFIQTNTPPAEMVFFNGEFFTARVAIESLIKTAKKRAIIIDHYVDAKTFDLFDVRQDDVQGIIYTQGVGAGMTRLKQEHDRQAGVQPVEVYKWRVEPHDRFLIIDDALYHCGHSLNATGSKLSAIMRMGISPEDILNEMT